MLEKLESGKAKLYKKKIDLFTTILQTNYMEDLNNILNLSYNSTKN